jgi:addiction module HigA family antidote
MDKKLFADLMESANQALEHAQGKRNDLRTTTLRRPSATKSRINAGMVLQDELEEIGISQSELAERVGVLPKTISEICDGKRNISPNMARKLSKAIGASPKFWLNLQANWELAQVNNTVFNRLEKITA